MIRRLFLKSMMALPAISTWVAERNSWVYRPVLPSRTIKRVRPKDPQWPSPESWNNLKTQVGGRLRKLESPFAACQSNPDSAACREILKELKNPYYIGDTPELTQSSGWLDAWSSKPSAFVVEAANTADVVAAVNFARENNLRLVVKGGGHSYKGTSNSEDSLLIWTRAMNRITLHETFVAKGCEGKQNAVPAVTIGAGSVWMHTYNAVTTKGGRYVQGGGCATVGVAGLIQGGGFGSFSKNYGMAAAALLEAEIVTADGEVRIANACTNPDLFWGLKGGGGGSLGVVTQLTLRTRELPKNFGAVFATIKASSDDAFHKLIARILGFYREKLLNPHWGEQMGFRSNNLINISMVFQGLELQQAKNTWQPLLDWLATSPEEYSFEQPLMTVDVPAQHFWDPDFINKNYPQVIITDDRAGASPENIFWASNEGEAGAFWHGYKSAWLPVSLLKEGKENVLAEALFAASRHWTVSLHFNKGLAGAPEEEIAAARDTAMNPAVLDAFALVIIADDEPPSYPGMPGEAPDLVAARKDAKKITMAMDELQKVAPNAGSYVSESDFFEKNWQQSFWGNNYSRLAAVKTKYDPEGLFFVHHGVGSEEWSADGFVRLDKH